MSSATNNQIDLFTWARELERENKRIARATKARKRKKATAKVRPLAESRRPRVFLTTGTCRYELTTTTGSRSS